MFKIKSRSSFLAKFKIWKRGTGNLKSDMTTYVKKWERKFEMTTPIRFGKEVKRRGEYKKKGVNKKE